jgi:FkbM family methyltransferase
MSEPRTDTLVPSLANGDSAPIRHPHRDRNFLWRSLRFLLKGGDYCRVLGTRTGLRWFFIKVLARLPIPGVRRGVTSIKPPTLAYPIRVRMFPHSDDRVFDQVFITREHAPLGQLGNPGFILDLGANVGYASALFASHYPSARILAVEPDPGNYQVCVENLRPYGARVSALLGAVWTHRSRLALSQGDSGQAADWAVQVHETANKDNASVEAWDVPTLLDLAGEDLVDLAKIDIEGSEAEIFAANTAWLGRVRNICIELHGDRCREIFFRALRGYMYDVVEYGENTICLNLRRAEARSCDTV